jgi:hypothetical protein
MYGHPFKCHQLIGFNFYMMSLNIDDVIIDAYSQQMFSSRQQDVAVPRVAFALVLLFMLLLQCAFTSVSAADAAADEGTSMSRRELRQGNCWSRLLLRCFLFFYFFTISYTGLIGLFYSP